MYGLIKLLLEQECMFQDTVLIESPFKEETRLGAFCNTVMIALTPKNLVIAVEKKGECENNINFALESIYPLNLVKLAIFKRTHRQALKLVCNKKDTRYFELGRMQGRNIFWRLWCHHVKELTTNSSRWPYVTMKPSISRINPSLRWTDKYLYLGSKREIEDQAFPIAIPGIGRTEENLFYLKPQYSEVLDVTENCEQYNEEVEAKTHNYEDIAYTDDPHSNITYTSLMTTVGIIGQF